MKTFTVITGSGFVEKVPFPLNHKSIFDNSEPRSIATCINAVAENYGISAVELVGQERSREFTRPRQLAYLLARESTGKSYPTIGMRFRKDHSTVIHGINNYRKLMNKSEDLRIEPDILLDQVGGALPQS